MSDPIAARRDDHHLCMQHVGANILPACAPTILIGSKPAARVTDLAECTGGPVDIVQTGEPTVLLSGKMAARFGDGTNHGGLIDQGHPTVIIGKMTAPDKRMRLMERLRLIDAARKKAASMPSGAEKDRLSGAAERLAQNNKAVEDARLAQSVYQTEGAPEGWTRLSQDQLPDSLKGAVLRDDSTGFYSDIYRSEIDGSYRLVFRGTEPSTWQDWVKGNSQGTNIKAPQYTQAVDLSKQVAAEYGGNLGIAGHSLGGGLASVGSLATGVPANTFNAAGVAPATYYWYGLDSSQANNLIDSYKVDGDILTKLQQDSLISWGMPNAIGTNHDLNAVDMATNPDGSRTFTPRPDFPKAPEIKKPDHWWEWATKPGQTWDSVKDWGKGQVDEKMGWASEATTRHGLYENGIEQQKEGDLATIKGML
jgi:uncharacterized Zn-binding protein involved in type VI secretion